MSAEESKAVNVEVVVRCRPLNGEEKRDGTPPVISTSTDRNEILVSHGATSKRVAKTYTFDKVFGMYSTQQEVFDTAVVPIIDEVLEGYNCTLFAYGQTGTGKTHTMEGSLNDPEHAGIIPRSVRRVFDYLETRHTEYSVRISFLELYNESLADLMVPVEDAPKIRIVEDARKGTSCQNLEEVLCHNAEDVFSQLGEAVKRRQTAETLMNKQSSRSHCIFTLTIHIKETTPDGEDLLKIGKLNLVDLAGSECIGRSGAKDKRAREAGNINMSLLTLGRVITALVEHHPHVPYRDSKLTRLLQDSLGGRTKTCVIATLSPSVLAVDETMSTLEYASRAKNIKNKPEANQRMTKRALLREYSVEIERLKAELQATREKNGVYLPAERYEQMELLISGQGNQLSELEGSYNAKMKEFKEMQSLFECTTEELAEAKETLTQLKSGLEEAKSDLAAHVEVLKGRTIALEETGILLHAHAEANKTLEAHSKGLVSTLETTVADVSGLWAKVGRKADVEASNLSSAAAFEASMGTALSGMASRFDAFEAAQRERHAGLRAAGEAFLEQRRAEAATLEDQLAAAAKDGAEHSDEAMGRVQGAARASRDAWAAAAEGVVKGAAELTDVAKEGSTVTAKLAADIKSAVSSTADDAAAFVDAAVSASAASLAACEECVASQRAVMDSVMSAVAAHVASMRSEIDALRGEVDTFKSERAAADAAAHESIVAAFSAQLKSHFDAAASARADTAVGVGKRLDAVATGVAGVETATSEAVDSLQGTLKSFTTARAEHTAAFAATAEAAKAATLTAAETTSGIAVKCAEAGHEFESKVRAASQAAGDAFAATKEGALESMAAFVSDFEAAEAEGAEAAAGHRAALSSAATEAVEWAEAHASDIDAQVKACEEAAAQHVSENGEWRGSVKDDTHTFVASTLRRDVPTGATPVQREYEYKRSAPKPRSQRSILAQYRESRVSEAEALAAHESVMDSPVSRGSTGASGRATPRTTGKPTAVSSPLPASPAPAPAAMAEEAAPVEAAPVDVEDVVIEATAEAESEAADTVTVATEETEESSQTEATAEAEAEADAEAEVEAEVEAAPAVTPAKAARTAPKSAAKATGGAGATPSRASTSDASSTSSTAETGSEDSENVSAPARTPAKTPRGKSGKGAARSAKKVAARGKAAAGKKAASGIPRRTTRRRAAQLAETTNTAE